MRLNSWNMMYKSNVIGKGDEYARDTRRVREGNVVHVKKVEARRVEDF